MAAAVSTDAFPSVPSLDKSVPVAVLTNVTTSPDRPVAFQLVKLVVENVPSAASTVCDAHAVAT